MIHAGRSTVYSLFRDQARWRPGALAIECAGRRWSYGELAEAVETVAGGLRRRGLERGDRVAVLSENRVEYTLLQLAAARIGAIVACLNWRLAPGELAHCVRLVVPKLLIASSRHAALATGLGSPGTTVLPLDDDLVSLRGDGPDREPPTDDPEDGLLLLYTSGTTGLPKAASGRRPRQPSAPPCRAPDNRYWYS